MHRFYQECSIYSHKKETIHSSTTVIHPLQIQLVLLSTHKKWIDICNQVIYDHCQTKVKSRKWFAIWIDSIHTRWIGWMLGRPNKLASCHGHFHHHGVCQNFVPFCFDSQILTYSHHHRYLQHENASWIYIYSYTYICESSQPWSSIVIVIGWWLLLLLLLWMLFQHIIGCILYLLDPT